MTDVQAAALAATFVNVKLHEHLPHDTSGEARRIWQFVRRRLLVCQWSVAAVFGVQVPLSRHASVLPPEFGQVGIHGNISAVAGNFADPCCIRPGFA